MFFNKPVHSGRLPLMGDVRPDSLSFQIDYIEAAFHGEESMHGPIARIVEKQRDSALVIALGAALGIALWVSDALLDFSPLNHTGALIDCLVLDVPAHVFIARGLVLVSCTGFGVVASRYAFKSARAEIRYRKVFENSHDAMILSWKGHAEIPRFVEANPAAYRMLGYSEKELLGMSFRNVLDKERLPDFLTRLNRPCIQESFSPETVFLHKDGSKIFAEVNTVDFELDGDPVCLSVIRDITECRQNAAILMESERQLQHLTSQLLFAQESERSRISGKLHDELGQALTYLKFRVASLESSLKEKGQSGHAPREGASLLPYLDEMIEYVRTLSRDLSPSFLEELGFVSAIRCLIEDFCACHQTGVDTLELDDVDDLFPRETEISIFRVLQECLANIARHSRATMISVNVKRQADRVFFEISDNGRGFDIDQVFLLKKGIGIPSMRERVRITGGEFDFRSEIDKGTRVSFIIPFPMKGSQQCFHAE